MEIPVVGGYDKHPLEWKFQWGGGSKTKVPSLGRCGYFLELHIVNYALQTLVTCALSFLAMF